jgi:hypothetical protein
VKRSFVATVSAALLTAALSLPALAQVQLAEEVATKLSELGFQVDGLVLTEEQVMQIENVVNSTDEEDAKKEQINQILAE